jgi:hypothetical protein
MRSDDRTVEGTVEAGTRVSESVLEAL